MLLFGVMGKIVIMANSELAVALDEESDERYLLLRQANQSLTASLVKEKARTEEVVAAAYQGARDAAASLVIPAVIPPSKQKKKGSEEWALPMLSDTQLGKETHSYNSSVCAERVDRYANKILALTDLQRSNRPVRYAHVSMLGDMVEGEDIFPGQQWVIDSSLFQQVMVNGPEIFMPFFLKLLGKDGFESIVVDCVDGNHGRVGRKGAYHPQTNMDRFLYTFLKGLFEKEPKYRGRIKFNTGEDLHPTEQNWYRIARIGNYSALQIHGWEIRGNGPWHGITLKNKVNGWASGGITESFQDMFMGHYHQVGIIPLNKRKVYVNGSTESDNDYASHIIAAQSEPHQWLLFVDPKKGRVTNSYDVALLED